MGAGGPPDKEAQLLESWKAYKTGFQQGIALFNKKPKKGVAFMQDQVRTPVGRVQQYKAVACRRAYSGVISSPTNTSPAPLACNCESCVDRGHTRGRA